jgi:alpha-L-fucosidase
VFGYKDICNLWKAEHFDANATVKQFKDWGAKYVAIMANHHDNFDLFYSSVHQWNAVNVGPHRDIVGEVAKAARANDLKWVATVHAFRSKGWFKPAFGADLEGPKKGIPYDGNLTKADGKGKWWEGLDPQQLYAYKNPLFESELTQRTLDLVNNYQPDMLYFDDHFLPAPYVQPVQQLYLNSYKKNGSVQAIATVKNTVQGTLQDIEKAVTPKIQPACFQTDTTLASDWFLKPNPDGSSPLRHNARSLKELLVDIASKNGSLLLNIAVRADGTIPEDQFDIMQEFGAWLNANGEAIFSTRPWKAFGEGGVDDAIYAISEKVAQAKQAKGLPRTQERTINSEPWDYKVLRFTRSKDNTVLFAFVFGNPTGKQVVIKSLADKKLFEGTIKSISLIGGSQVIKWSLDSDGLHVSMPPANPFKDCNVLKITTDGL